MISGESNTSGIAGINNKLYLVITGSLSPFFIFKSFDFDSDYDDEDPNYPLTNSTLTMTVTTAYSYAQVSTITISTPLRSLTTSILGISKGLPLGLAVSSNYTQTNCYIVIDTVTEEVIPTIDNYRFLDDFIDYSLIFLWTATVLIFCLNTSSIFMNHTSYQNF
jgi:hypothetical protein